MYHLEVTRLRTQKNVKGLEENRNDSGTKHPKCSIELNTTVLRLTFGLLDAYLQKWLWVYHFLFRIVRLICFSKSITLQAVHHLNSFNKLHLRIFRCPSFCLQIGNKYHLHTFPGQTSKRKKSLMLLYLLENTHFIL